MGYQVLKQPDGMLAVFSTGTDRWLRWGMEPDEVVEYLAERAAEDARRSAWHTVTSVLMDEPQDGLGMTFAEANAHSQHHGGEVLDGPVDAGMLARLEGPL